MTHVGSGPALLVLIALLLIALLLPPTRPMAFAAEGPAMPGPPRRAVCIETSANLRLLASREAIRALVARAKSAGIDTLIPEAKNAWGFVIYESAIAPHIRTSPVPRSGYAAPLEWYPKSFDALQAIIEEAHAAGLRVHAAVNIFGEGLRLDPAAPVMGQVQHHPEWESVHLRVGPGGRVVFARSSEAGVIAFVNPSHPEAQLYEQAIVWEILSRYAVDGIVLDRTRYADRLTDFSDLSRAQFERVLGERVGRWPDDVLQPVPEGVLRPGPHFPAWIAWRASVIQAFVRATARTARRMRPGMPVGMYVGAWYPTIFEVGQNWATPEAPRLFPAWSPAWAQASLVPDLDYVMIGLYYRATSPWETPTRQGAWWRTVAGGAVMARQLTGATPVLGSVWLDLYRADRGAGERALRAAARLTDGLMAFDLSDVEEGNWWSMLSLR